MSAPTVTCEELFAQLATLTSMKPEEWKDFCDCTHEEQMIIVDGYKDQSWVKSPDILAKVIEILALIGTIAGTATGVGGAISAIKAIAT